MEPTKSAGPGSQPVKPASSPYIVSPRADLILIVGAAILCPALILPLAQLTSPKTVWLVVMTFGAVGHHLPSFLRTYGDPDIFQENLSSALQQLSQERGQAGRKNEAIELAREAIEHQPDAADSHNNLGMHLANAGRFDAAEQAWKRALELDPNYTLARQNLELLARVRRSAAAESGTASATTAESVAPPRPGEPVVE